MPFKPSVLILEKSSFPAHIELEEYERPEKTADQKDAIVRFQRPKATGKFEKFVRFFSDLLHGVTKAKGKLLNRPHIPGVIHIRGISCESTFIAEGGRQKCYVAPKNADSNKNNIEFSRLVVEIREDPEIKALSEKALFRSMKQELKDRFDVYGRTDDMDALNTFLELAQSKKPPRNIREIQRLQEFSDVLSQTATPIFDELTAQVKECVTATLRDAQEKVRKIKTSVYTNTPLMPDFTFSLLKKLDQTGPREFRPPPGDPPPALPEVISPLTSLVFIADQRSAEVIARAYNSPPPASSVLPPDRPPPPIPSHTAPSVSSTPSAPPALPTPPEPLVPVDQSADSFGSTQQSTLLESIRRGKENLKVVTSGQSSNNHGKTVSESPTDTWMANVMKQRRKDIAPENKQSDDEWQ